MPYAPQQVVNVAQLLCVQPAPMDQINISKVIEVIIGKVNLVTCFVCLSHHFVFHPPFARLKFQLSQIGEEAEIG